MLLSESVLFFPVVYYLLCRLILLHSRYGPIITSRWALASFSEVQNSLADTVYYAHQTCCLSTSDFVVAVYHLSGFGHVCHVYWTLPIILRGVLAIFVPSRRQQVQGLLAIVNISSGTHATRVRHGSKRGFLCLGFGQLIHGNFE